MLVNLYSMYLTKLKEISYFPYYINQTSLIPPIVVSLDSIQMIALLPLSSPKKYSKPTRLNLN